MMSRPRNVSNTLSAETLQNRKGRAATLASFTRAARVHQWAKNLLILAPFVAAHQPLTLGALGRLGLGVLVFSLTASAAYLINDLIDLDHDRRHPQKRNRPLASGQLSVRTAVVGVVLLAISASLLTLRLPVMFTLLALGYFVVTCLYSVWLKRLVVADVIVLALLYVWRLGAGAALMDIPLSQWFMVFSVFLFFSLALVKRYSELARATARGIEHASGRGYGVGDLFLVSQFGTMSGLIAVLVYCLYISSPDVSRLYDRPEILWVGLPLLLFWICRLWVLAARGQVQEDPLVFAFTDRVSYLVAVAMSVVILAAA
jgi:4-hydroxybenzoate polyprenyltransferase